MSTQTISNATAMDVLKTKDYELFSYLNGNRSLNALHLKRLTESIKEKYLVCPIIVNDKYQIIDGQHRFEAIKSLKLPLFYIIIKNYGLEEVQRFNSNQKNFSYEDYLTGYVDLGYEDYTILKEFKDRYKFDWNTSIALLSGYAGGDSGYKFKNGDFKIKDLKKADATAQKIEEIGQYYSGYRRKYFLVACMKMLGTKGYDQRQMIEKLKYLSAKLVDCSSTEDYLKILETVYNFKSRSETLRFL